MLIIKRTVLDNNEELNQYIPWQMKCPGCGEIVYFMEKIRYHRCWNCNTVVSMGTDTITTGDSSGRINYHSNGWALNDNRVERDTE